MTSDEGPIRDESDDSAPKELKDIATLALHLHSQKPAFGEKPTEEDVWEWMHGNLHHQRAAEVQSHIARDPDTYSLWRSFRAAVHEFGDDYAATPSDVENTPSLTQVKGGTSKPQGFMGTASSTEAKKAWWHTVIDIIRPPQLRFMGFATASVLGGIIAINMLSHKEPPPDFWQGWQIPKSQIQTLSSEDQAAYQSVLAGMNDQLNELSFEALGPDGRLLPSQSPACQQGSENSPCNETYQALYELGQLVVDARLLCLTLHALPDQAKATMQQEAVDIARRLSGQPEGDPFAGPLEQWTSSEEPRRQCAAVNTIIDRALRGLSN